MVKRAPASIERVLPKARPKFDHEPGVVASCVYKSGEWIADIPVSEAGAWAKKPAHVVWLGLYEPSDDLLRRVQHEFEPARPRHRGCLAGVTSGPRSSNTATGFSSSPVRRKCSKAEFCSAKLTSFVGHGYVISIRHGASTSYSAVRTRAEACPGSFAKGEHYILYAILDFIVDNYMPVLEMIEDEVDELEETVVSTALGRSEVERLYQLRRDLLRLRNSVVPLVDVCRRLEHSEICPSNR